MRSSLEIAQAATLRPIAEIAEEAGILPGELELTAENRQGIGVPGVERGLDVELEGVPRVVAVHRDFLDDHPPLGVDLHRIERETAQTVGLDLERFGPAVRREGEPEGGDVVAGEGVVGAAERLGPPVDLAGPEALRALEHQVLEEVREPAPSGRLVARADPEEDRGGDDRRLAVDQHGELEPVGETVDRDLSGERGRPSRESSGRGRAQLRRGRRPPACGKLTETVVGFGPPGCASMRIR